MKNNYRLTFLRTNYKHLEKSAPIGCVAIQYDTKTSQVKYQVSVQNPEDHFDRSVARRLALGGIIECPFSFHLKTKSMHEITRAVMTDIKNNKSLPSRAVKAAKAWLNNVESEDATFRRSLVG